MNHPASKLIGAKPNGSVKTLSLAVGKHLSNPQYEKINNWLVACSGGADSLALTIATADWCARHNRQCQAVIIDHQLRPESTREAKETQKLLQELKIAVTIIPVTVQRTTAGIEADARTARYAALTEHANTYKPHETGILLGHTKDDQAETILIKLARGASLRTLAGMRQNWVTENGVTYARPLLETVRRADTEGFCHTLQIPWVTDPSNALDGPWKTAAGLPLPRIAVRHQLLPLLNQVLGQDTVTVLTRLAKQVGEDADLLDEYAHTAFTTATTEQKNQLDVTALEKLKKPLRMRVWKLYFAQFHTQTLTAVHLNELDRLITQWQGQGPVSLPGGWQARRIRIIEKTQLGEKRYKTVKKRILLELKNRIVKN